KEWIVKAPKRPSKCDVASIYLQRADLLTGRDYYILIVYMVRKSSASFAVMRLLAHRRFCQFEFFVDLDQEYLFCNTFEYNLCGAILAKEDLFGSCA
ncbi:MAG: hypothetical protein AAFX62_15005, partial [Pseudomonadota bacterium]